MSETQAVSPGLEEGEISENEANGHDDQTSVNASRQPPNEHLHQSVAADRDPSTANEVDQSSRTYESAKARKVIARKQRVSAKSQKPRARPSEPNRDRDDDRRHKEGREVYGTARSRRWNQERKLRANARARALHQAPSHDERQGPVSEEPHDYPRHHAVPEDVQYQSQLAYHDSQATYAEPRFEQASHRPAPQQAHHPPNYPPNYSSFPPQQNPYEQTEPPHPSQPNYPPDLPPTAQMTSDYNAPPHHHQQENISVPPPSYYMSQPVYDDQRMTMDSHPEQHTHDAYYDPEPQDYHHDGSSQHAPQHTLQYASHHQHPSHPSAMANHEMREQPPELYPPHHHHQQQQQHHQQPTPHSHQILMDGSCQLAPQLLPQEHHPNQDYQQPITTDHPTNGHTGEYAYHHPQDPYTQAQVIAHSAPEFEYDHHRNGFQHGFQMIHEHPQQPPRLMQINPSQNHSLNHQQNPNPVQYASHDPMHAQYDESLNHFETQIPSTQPQQLRVVSHYQPPMYSGESSFPSSRCDTHVYHERIVDLEAEQIEVRALISELVSWGVTAEYLLDIGISKPLIFRTFQELGFRLPPCPTYVETKPTPTLASNGSHFPQHQHPHIIIHPVAEQAVTDDIDGVEVKSHRESSIGFLLDQHTPNQSPRESEGETQVGSPIVDTSTDPSPHPLMLEGLVVDKNGAPRTPSQHPEEIILDSADSDTVNTVSAMRKSHRQALRLALSNKSARRVESLKDDLKIIFHPPGPLQEAVNIELPLDRSSVPESWHSVVTTSREVEETKSSLENPKATKKPSLTSEQVSLFKGHKSVSQEIQDQSGIQSSPKNHGSTSPLRPTPTIPGSSEPKESEPVGSKWARVRMLKEDLRDIFLPNELIAIDQAGDLYLADRVQGACVKHDKLLANRKEVGLPLSGATDVPINDRTRLIDNGTETGTGDIPSEPVSIEPSGPSEIKSTTDQPTTTSDKGGNHNKKLKRKSHPVASDHLETLTGSTTNPKTRTKRPRTNVSPDLKHQVESVSLNITSPLKQQTKSTKKSGRSTVHQPKVEPEGGLRRSTRKKKGNNEELELGGSDKS